tara:strand:+ start:230 stop:487 length:258 start_codon:yes stop_codon:yes gene_type:complete
MRNKAGAIQRGQGLGVMKSNSASVSDRLQAELCHAWLERPQSAVIVSDAGSFRAASSRLCNVDNAQQNSCASAPPGRQARAITKP